MVYGEFITGPSLKLAKLLAKNLPKNLQCTYFTNSGTEALEGSLKLARRYTGRKKIIAAKNAYHGSTMGALTLMGLEERKKPFEPLIPNVEFIVFNSFEEINKRTGKSESDVIKIMRRSLKPSSFRLWRKRVNSQSIKHRKKFEYSRKNIRRQIKESDYI